MPRISALPTATTAAGADEFPIVQGAVTKRLSFATAQASGLFLPSNLSITTAKLADGAVTSDKLQASPTTDANRAVTTNHIQDLAVTTAKIADLNVTTIKLADASVTAPKIASGALTISKFTANDKTFLSNAASSRPGATVITSGSVEDIVVYNTGTGYSTTPTITISTSPTGDTATATCTIVGGSVATVTITNPGSGYTSDPVVTFSSSPGTTAQAFAYSITNGLSNQDGDRGSVGGQNFGMFITSDKQVKALGYNTNYQLGTGWDNNIAPLPRQCEFWTQVTGPIKPWKVVVSYNNSYVIDTKGRVWCAGYGNYGQLGNNSTGDWPIFFNLAQSYFGNKPVVKLITNTIAQANTVIAITADNKAYGWGYNGVGELGQGSNSTVYVPVAIGSSYNISDAALVGSGGAVSAYYLEAGNTGRVLVCGQNNQGSLSQGNTSNINTLQYLLKSAGVPFGTGVEGKVIKVVGGGSNGFNFVYLLTDTGQVWTAGYGDYGQLGTGGGTTGNGYAALTNITSGATDIFVASSSERFGFGFVKKSDGSLWGTGYNGYGNLGGGGTTGQNPFIKVWDPVARGETIRKVCAYSSGYPNAYSGSFFLTDQGNLYFNGYTSYGVGATSTGSYGPNNTPIILNNHSSYIVDFRFDSYPIYVNPRVLMSDGKVYTCGYNGNFELGNGYSYGYYTGMSHICF